MGWNHFWKRIHILLIKVHIFWECHKIWKKIFHWHYSVANLLSSIKSKQSILSNFCSLLRISELYPHFNDIYFFIFRGNPATHKVENSFRKDFPLLMQSCLEAVWPATYQNLSGLKCISYKVRTNFLINHSWKWLN